MRHRTTVQTVTTTKSTSGTLTETWADERTVWAEFIPTGGEETRMWARDYPTATHMVKMQRDPNYPLTTKKRLVYNGNNYDILYVQNEKEIERRGGMLNVITKAHVS